jgi:hypothetical protein
MDAFTREKRHSGSRVRMEERDWVGRRGRRRLGPQDPRRRKHSKKKDKKVNPNRTCHREQ